MAQTAALSARVEAFWVGWEKDARNDMARKAPAEAQKPAEGEDVASESPLVKNSSIVPGKMTRRGRPPKIGAFSNDHSRTWVVYGVHLNAKKDNAGFPCHAGHFFLDVPKEVCLCVLCSVWFGPTILDTCTN